MQAFVRRAAVGIALLSIPAVAPLAADEHHHHAMPATASDALSDGIVRKVDRAAGKLTIAHGPIANVGMPPMTMAFKVAEPNALAGIKEGDKLRFRVEDRKGVLTVVRIEAAK